MGDEFFEYMKKPFKYALDKEYFASPYYEEADNIDFGKELLDRKDAKYDIEDDEKIQSLCAVKNDEGKITEVTNNDKYYLNDKVIIFENKINNNNYKNYFKSVIINYLMQVIPSTAIFVLKNFELKTNNTEK